MAPNAIIVVTAVAAAAHYHQVGISGYGVLYNGTHQMRAVQVGAYYNTRPYLAG